MFVAVDKHLLNMAITATYPVQQSPGQSTGQSLGQSPGQSPGQSSSEGVTRRRFLEVSALSGAGFLIGCGDSSTSGESAALPASGPGSADDVSELASAAVSQSELNHFVRIGSDNTVTVICKHLDKGQGVTTGLPTIVAEELDADWAQMRHEFAPADGTRYGNEMGFQITGGSSSIANSWDQLRQAAAAARGMLVGAAAEAWTVAPTEISVERGVLKHSSGQQASFGEMAAAAAELAPPAELTLKQPTQFKLIGTHVPRLDSVAKTDGTAQFTIDVDLPGTLIAVVARPPRFGAVVKWFEDSNARVIAGVEDVVQIPRGVAVLADSYWSASRGRDALSIEWDFSDAENRSSDQIAEDFVAQASSPGAMARDDGDVDAALSAAEKVIEARFDFPFLAHATMEPMDCVVELRDDDCEIWTGSQSPTLDQTTAAQLTGLRTDQVKINTVFAGGSFGRRAVPDSDFVAEATMIAKAINGRAPVKLQWSREDDMRSGRYRPMSHHVMRAGLDADGKITGWHHRLVIQSILVGTPFASFAIKDGVDGSAVEGARGLPYAIDNLRVDQHLGPTGVPVLWWRSVGHTHNGYATEVFFDQIAAAAGKDPVTLRRELLEGHDRHLAVLNLAAEKADWGEPLLAGKARGIAVHESFNTLVAQVAEVTVAGDGSFKVDRVVCAVDCGIAVNPDVVKAQMEGGIGYGLSAALREAVTLVDGQVQETNFDRYRPLRIDEMPAIEVHIVPSNNAPTGVGEPGTPPIGPAVANALFAATGKVITRLPIGDQLRS